MAPYQAPWLLPAASPADSLRRKFALEISEETHGGSPCCAIATRHGLLSTTAQLPRCAVDQTARLCNSISNCNWHNLQLAVLGFDWCGLLGGQPVGLVAAAVAGGGKLSKGGSGLLEEGML